MIGHVRTYLLSRGLEFRACGIKLPLVNGLLVEGAQSRRCSDASVPSFNVRPGLQAGYSFEHIVPSSE